MTAIHDWLDRYTSFTCKDSHRIGMSSKDDREFYDGVNTVVLFMTGICNLCPPRALHLAMRTVRHFLGDADLDEQLVSARTVVLCDNSTKKQLQEQLDQIPATWSKEERQIKTCKGILTNLLRWRIEMPEDPKRIMKLFSGVFSRVVTYLRRSGVEGGDAVVTAYLKTALPFEEWQLGMFEETYKEVPYVGFSEYYPIGEINEQTSCNYRFGDCKPSR